MSSCLYDSLILCNHFRTLGARYQSRENALATTFIAHCSIIQLTAAGIYGPGTVLTRMFKEQWFGNDYVKFVAAHEAFYVSDLLVGKNSNS